MRLHRLHPEQIVDKDVMFPAVWVEVSLVEVARHLNAEPAARDRGTLLLSYQVDLPGERAVVPAQVALIAFREDPEYTHVFVKEADLGTHPVEQLKMILRALHLNEFEVGWWTREGHAEWPGNRPGARLEV
ncbi:hypothetical protein [Ralstonia thomasii]|uniref:hypothetical protein n=1 Tax=Ralstonia thomasii TaxID=3058596 RepID=UPI00292D12AC|nr:hypothetical protein [Ralstonia sp. LMG 18095]